MEVTLTDASAGVTREVGDPRPAEQVVSLDFPAPQPLEAKSGEAHAGDPSASPEREKMATVSAIYGGGSHGPLRITVIGSGASGLAAAFRLQQAGHRVRVLEQSDRIGSTLRSRREHEFLLDQGAFFLTSAHTRMLRIVEEAGLLDQIVPDKLVIGRSATAGFTSSRAVASPDAGLAASWAST